MRKYIYLAIALLGLASCEKDDVTNLYIEEGAIQVVFNGANPFGVDDGTEVGFKLIPVGNNTSGKFSSSDPKKGASSSKTDSAFNHVFGNYTVTLRRNSTGQTYDFLVENGLVASQGIILPDNELIEYSISSANTGQFEDTLPLGGSGSFTVSPSSTAVAVDLEATSRYSLVTINASQSLNSTPTFAGTELTPLLDDGLLYKYVEENTTGQVSGTWSQTVSGTEYSGDFASAEFTTVAYNHYHYTLDVSYQVVDVAGNGATTVNFTITLAQTFQQEDQTISVSFDVGNPIDEDHVFTYNILLEDLIVQENAFGQDGFDDLNGLSVGTTYQVLDQNGNKIGDFILQSGGAGYPYAYILANASTSANIGGGTYDIAE